MKHSAKNAKAPFAKGKFSKVKNVRYLSWEDAFDVEFEDGLSFLEPHATIRKANRISAKSLRCPGLSSANDRRRNETA